MHKGKFPTHCPSCNELDSFDYEDINSYKEGLQQEVICSNCDTSFTEYFKPIGWSE